MGRQKKWVTGYWLRVTGYELRVARKGFTLVEILVATTILVIAMASIYVSFQGGVTAWTKGTARMKVYLNARGALDMMSRELSAAFIYSTNNQFFYGRPNYLNFVAVMEPMNAVTDLYTIDYSYSPNDKEIQRIDEASVGSDITSPITGTPVPLASRVTNLSLHYYDGSIWQPTWDSTGVAQLGKLPQAVKIEITMQKEKETSQAAAKVFSTVIFIPASRGQ